MAENTPPKTPTYASPACMAPEVDQTQARDVAVWRKAKRTELRDARKTLSASTHADLSAQITARLEDILHRHCHGAKGQVFSMYWPIKGEPDLRTLMGKLHKFGVRIALPSVETKAAPLVFRLWTPDAEMTRGDWNIPVLTKDAARVTPDITLAPLVGWDPAGYRLGYGGGYFDRTLAALPSPPLKIGVGYDAARLPTIYPQEHDIAMDVIVTETGAHAV
ncbi:5-formyltetrahydrofolate cyclo-ligase [Litoreibacter albidus]|uniref:5-formyltetrahydrofolate cyclo-ligase n=1 Tax=Litoreibacter albidus TaxID=670155 RepID=UPI003735442F